MNMRTIYGNALAVLIAVFMAFGAGTPHAETGKTTKKAVKTVSKKKKTARAPALSPGPSVPSPQAETAPDKIMRMVEEQNRADNELFEVKMELVGKDGKPRERTATLYTKEKNADDAMRLIRFHAPADLDGSGVLTIEYSDRDNDQWVYIPAYHTTRRIAASNLGDSYMGTDYCYEDAINPVIEKYAYEVLRKETIHNVLWFVIKATPKDEKLRKETTYSSIVYWVDTARSVVFKTSYFDKKGEILKELTNSKLEKCRYKNGTKYRWGRSEMRNLRTGHATITTVMRREIGKELSRDIFTERYLKKASQD